jgi:DNA-binding NtrC family response regulator
MHPTVLIIDDEPAVLDLLKEFLTLSYYRVETASSADEAVFALARMENTPMAVFVDLALENGGGVDLIRQLRTIPRLAAARFVGLSGALSPDAASAAMQAGCHGFIAKPFRMNDFLPFITEGARLPDPS